MEEVVGRERFERSTSAVSGRRHNLLVREGGLLGKLDYRPLLIGSCGVCALSFPISCVHSF